MILYNAKKRIMKVNLKSYFLFIPAVVQFKKQFPYEKSMGSHPTGGGGRGGKVIGWVICKTV